MTQPADTDLSRLVRDILEDRAAAVDVRTPEWAQFEARLRRIRTARRHRAAVAGSVLATAAVIAVGVTAGHLGAGERALDDPATRPSPTVSPRPTTFPVKLDDGHVRGSLKHDSAWLAAFRAAVARDVKRPVASIRIAYASDVGNRRIAYVFAGPTTGRRIAAWYEGRRGRKDATDMWRAQSHNFGGSAVDPSWDAYNLPLGNGDSVGGMIVVTTHDQTWQIADPPTYRPEGSVARSVRTVHPDAEGVLEIALPMRPGATYLVRSANEPGAPRWLPLYSLDTALTAADGRPALTGLPLVHDVPAADVNERTREHLSRLLF
jgi:hypothetical protein